MTLVYRPLNENDLENILDLIEQSNAGLTTLPHDKDVLYRRIQASNTSLTTEVTEPKNEFYFFGLEDTSTQRIVGVSAIDAAAGYNFPFYSYKMSSIVRICSSLDIRNEYKFLSLVNDYQGKTELCSLLLAPQYRQNRNGLFLSRVRLLFLAQFQQRFSDTVFAEMRGVCNEEGISPFWEGLGRHFFHMEFAEADRLTISTDKQFVADLMPRKAIYVELLPPDAQEAVGKTHAMTTPALKILTKEGFSFQGYIDIFDGGPTLEAKSNAIQTITNSRLCKVKDIREVTTSESYMLCNLSLAFRALRSNVEFINENEIVIDSKTAELLQTGEGETIRLCTF